MQLRNRLAALPSPARLDALGRVRAVLTFRVAARTVPAYANLLRHLGVDARRVWSYRQFRRRVPLTDAGHYADAYPSDERCAAHAHQGGVVAVETTGGHIALADRAERARLRRDLRHLLTFIVDARRRPTLAVVLRDDAMALCLDRFSDALRSLSADSRLRLSVAGPLSDAQRAHHLLRRFRAPDRQVLYIGSQAALQRAVESAAGAGVLCIGNDDVPDWRALVSDRLRIGRPLRAGRPQIMRCLVDAADGWPLAWDSPFTMLVTELTTRDSRLCQALFDAAVPPPIAQFDPLASWIEVAGGCLCITRFGAQPRVRFLTDVHGATFSADDVNACLKQHGYDAVKLLRALGWPPGVRYPMPICRLHAAPARPVPRPPADDRAAAPKPIVATYIR